VGTDSAPFASIVVPVLDEAAALAALLPALSPSGDVEVLVAEAAGRGGVLETIRACHPGVRWIGGRPGRATQMNAAAREAAGGWIVFLHVDTRLPADWLGELGHAARDPRIVGGSFRFGLDSPSWWARVIERGVQARVRWLDLPYGDQALFVRRDVFQRLGGFRELPLMEDVDFVRRLRREGRLYHSRAGVTTSARRWERDGWIRRSAMNVGLVLLFLAGVPAGRLAPIYNGRRPGSGGRD
jgi:rSAM/selenodomain-associated transferase 2